jgi:electron transport complex protein RnfE
MRLGFMFGMMTLGFMRELLGSGTLLGHDILGVKPLLFFILPAAGFFCVGFIMALFNYVELLFKRMKEKRD